MSRPFPPPVTLNSSTLDLLGRNGNGHDENTNGDVQSPSDSSPRTNPPLRALTPQSPTVGSPRTTFYQQSPVQSSDMLLPPSGQRRFQEYVDSPTSSRRSSWSTDHRGSAFGPFVSPFDESRGSSRVGSPDPMDALNSQTISDKYNIIPSDGLLLFPVDKEDDDALHDPTEQDPNECDIWTKRGLVNVGGLAFIVLGLLCLFIGYPILTFVRDVIIEPEPENRCDAGEELCIDIGPIDLLKNVRRSLIDPDTPVSARTKKSASGKEYKLVFSDEFNKPGRTFYPQDDPYWEAVDIHYAATGDLEWYDPDAITTKDGYLEIEFAAFRNHDLDYRSGMLQSWNKMCFKGGIIEASLSLPGRGDVSGFWPGFWTMGNLGRPGYLATTEGMWPYTYHDECDAGITTNQSSLDGINFLPGMKLPACTCANEDHPSPGKSRSAPEIDAIEASVGAIDKAGEIIIGSASQSAQVAPFDLWYQPDYDHVAVYHPEFTAMNAYRGGFFQEAISGISILNNDWYDGKQYQTYGFEYEPGSEGMIEWNIGDLKTWRMNAAATGPNGNIGQRPIPNEPMAVIINVGMGSSFAHIDPEINKLLPAKMRVDWIRIWQDEDCTDCSVTCDPPGYPTTKYIEDHLEAFMNPNLTNWASTKHNWPKNTFVNQCT
ncbi:beta-glucan synthesis-associated [Choiromyces venosus 120613-1]|uniref:Beta-glucan synthesis-associated n=1 Tax=Choiromyces venosus 120613-1 TaxID=1336337 RepID=A0A3N4JK76_9PEZI|nr:beta-glucan synthesis-associated [Choiromyces venosus 120613-1]